MSAELTQSGAEILLRALKDQGVEVIFGYPGGAVLPIYDALFKQNAIRHILVRQEGGAVHAAEGYARSTGKVGVVLVTSGPGATNAVTGLVDALMDSIPVVCLTGQVPTHLIGNDAFQEADTTGITRPATKHNYLVKRAEDLARVVHEAFYVARSGRPGPVVIDLPKDIVINPAPVRGAGGPASQLPPAHRTRPRADRQGGRADEAGEAADDLCRRRRHQFRPRGLGGADQAGPPDRLSDHQHADGPGLLSGQRSAVPRHAGDARHLRGQPGDAWLRHDAGRRRPLRRPGDRPAERVQPGLAENPHRYRRVVDQQERAGRGADHRRCRQRAERAAGGLAGQRRTRPTSRRWPSWWRQIDEWRAQGQPEIHPGHDSAAASSSRNTRSSACSRSPGRAARKCSSPPKSASTRCGPRSTSTSRSRTTG